MEELRTNDIKTYLVQYALMAEFRNLAVKEGCEVTNVTEEIGRQLIVYWLKVPEGKHDLISDMAFMTFITNPKFQKYYTITDDLLAKIKEDNAAFEFSQEQMKPRNLKTI